MSQDALQTALPLEFFVEGQNYKLFVVATGEVLLEGWCDDPENVVDAGVSERIKAAAAAFHGRNAP